MKSFFRSAARLRRARLAPLLALALGAAHALSFAPWNLPWLQIVALAGLFVLALRSATPLGAALLGFAFGLGWFGVGVSWVYVSMHVYGGMPMPLAGLATAAFCAFLSLYPAAALAAGRWLGRDRALSAVVALPGAWAASEWLRGWLFTGFPWLASGYAHADGWLSGYAPVIGVYGITLVAALIGGALALLVLRTDVGGRARIVAALLLVTLAGGGAALQGRAWTAPSGMPIEVRLLQGNVPQDLKFADGGMRLSQQAYLPLLRGKTAADLIVLPESVFPLPAGDLPPPLMQELAAPLANGTSVIFGIFVEEPGSRYFNSALALTPNQGNAQRYSKRHLVPFGEFIPLGFRWFVDLMQIPIGDQARGARLQAPLRVAGQRIAVNICYEDLFGAEIIDAWRDPATGSLAPASAQPTLLLNLSNLAWFDDSLALDQHLQIARLRALETGRPMLRATNTGATAVIDAHGNVTAALPYLTAAVLQTQVRGHQGLTPYVQAGDLPALGAMAALLILAVLVRRRRDASRVRA